jgi:hypothetical protein
MSCNSLKQQKNFIRLDTLGFVLKLVDYFWYYIGGAASVDLLDKWVCCHCPMMSCNSLKYRHNINRLVTLGFVLKLVDYFWYYIGGAASVDLLDKWVGCYCNPGSIDVVTTSHAKYLRYEDMKLALGIQTFGLQTIG